jgi:hypothetical protein
MQNVGRPIRLLLLPLDPLIFTCFSNSYCGNICAGLKLKFSGLKTRRHDKKITQGMGMETFAVLFMIHALNRKVPWPIVLELEE